MNELIALIVIVVGVFIGWKVLVAALRGLGLAGEKIKSDGPEFLSKVFVSIAAGVIGGVVVGLTMGKDLEFMGPATVGIAAVAFVAQSFS